MRQPLQLHVYWLDKRASGNPPPRAALVEAQVKHVSARLVVDRREKIRGGFILSLSRIGSSYCPEVEAPGVRAADEFGHDGEHAGWTLGTLASSHRIELGGRNTEGG